MAGIVSEGIPFSEPPWLMGLPSPYYTDSHRKWQKVCRKFITENLHEGAMEWDREETLPESVFEKFAAANMLLPALGPLPIPWLKRLGIHDILGTKIEEWDYFHTAIYMDEVRFGLGDRKSFQERRY